MPDVREHIRNRYDLTYYGTQFLTGHGNFRSYLNRFGLCATDVCKWCKVPDTPEHVLYDCWMFTEQRVKLVERLSEIGVRLDLREICQRKVAVDIFNDIAAEIGRIREEHRIHEVV